MSLYKRAGLYWTDFSVDGTRYRKPLDTSDWREAQKRQKEKIGDAKAGKLSAAAQPFAKLTFAEALDKHLSDRSIYVTPRSHRTESDHAKPLRAYFGTTRVRDITAPAVLDYIRMRQTAGKSPVTINMERGILQRVLGKAKRWYLIEGEVPRLREPVKIGRAMEPDEKARLLRIAASRPEWETAYLATMLMLNTTMRGCEIKGLRWQDINFRKQELTIPRSKTSAGERNIPLNEDALWVVRRLRERIMSFYSGEPLAAWYLFPSGEGQGPKVGDNKATVRPNPMTPVKGWRTAWRRLTRAIECPLCDKLQNPGKVCVQCKADIRDLRSPSYGLRPHDMRHHAITELAESKASDMTIMSLAGHVSKKMLEHYSHIRKEAKRDAVNALPSCRPAREVRVLDVPALPAPVSQAVQ